jgi:hypothetical protein
MKTNYIFHSTCYDKELLRKQVICLNDNGIDYQLVSKENKTQVRAPLSGYFETEVHISEIDFERANLLLKDIIEKYA